MPRRIPNSSVPRRPDPTPQLIDYAGGGGAKAWTRTLDEALRLDSRMLETEFRWVPLLLGRGLDGLIGEHQ